MGLIDPLSFPRRLLRSSAIFRKKGQTTDFGMQVKHQDSLLINCVTLVQSQKILELPVGKMGMLIAPLQDCCDVEGRKRMQRLWHCFPVVDA